MRTRSVRRSAPLRMAGAAAVLGVLVTGCGPDVTAGAGPAEVAGSPTVKPTSSTPTPTLRPTPSSSPSLPPGDPGLKASGIPLPETEAPEPADHDEEARQKVPVEAMLDLPTVDMVVGGRWQRVPGGADECLRPEGARGERSMSYGGTARGQLVQTVATYPDSDEADTAVAALADAAATCGWTLKADPRLGSASVAAEEGARTMTAVSAEEGVLVLLVATGDYARDPITWGSLVDLAAGSSCPAGPEGCH